MILTEKQLKEIENFGAVFFEAEKIAYIMELDPEELKKEFEDVNTPGCKAYMKGMLMSEYALRVSEIELAKRGSSEAIKGAKEMITKLKLSALE